MRGAASELSLSLNEKVCSVRILFRKCNAPGGWGELPYETDGDARRLA